MDSTRSLSPSLCSSTDVPRQPFFANVAGWSLVGLAVILPFHDHTRSYEELFVYLPPIILFLYAMKGAFRPDSSGQDITFGPLIPFVVLIFLTAAVSTFFSMDIDSSLSEFRGQMLKFVLIYFSAMNFLRTKVWRTRVFAALLLTGMASAIHGIATYYSGSYVEEGRALGSLNSYTRSAMFFILLVPLILSVLLYSGGKSAWIQALLVLAILLGWWFTVVSQTRGAMGIILLSTLVLAGIKRWKWAVTLVAVCILLALSIPSFRDRVVTTKKNLANPNALLSDRIPLWETALRAIRQHPLTGIGYGSEIYQQEKVKKRFPMRNYKFQPHAHNFYLQAASEAGLLHLAGLLAFFVGFLTYAFGALRASHSDPPSLDRALLIGICAGVASMLLYGLVGHFHERRIAMMMWCLVALGCLISFEILSKSHQKSIKP